MGLKYTRKISCSKAAFSFWFALFFSCKQQTLINTGIHTSGTIKKIFVIFITEIEFIILVTGGIKGLGFLPFILQQLFENKGYNSANTHLNKILLY